MGQDMTDSDMQGLGSSNSVLPPLHHHAAFDLSTANQALRAFLCAEPFDKVSLLFCALLTLAMLMCEPSAKTRNLD